MFVAPSANGDIVLQEKYLVSITQGKDVKIAKNHTTGGELRACYDEDRLLVYFTEFSGKSTILRYFVGKDNNI